MDRLLGDLYATIIGGMATIFAVAVMLLHRSRKRQLRRVNQQLDGILADSATSKGWRFRQKL